MEIFRLSGVNLAYGEKKTEQEMSQVAKIDEKSDTEHQGERSSLLKKRGKWKAWETSPKESDAKNVS